MSDVCTWVFRSIMKKQLQFADDKPKPPTEPAALVPKDSNSVAEDDAPWRRTGSLRTRAQQESPPKTRKLSG